MAYSTLISTADLERHLSAPDWVIVDCTFDLTVPAWGFEEYQHAHIPGAVYASLDKDLAGPVTQNTGRHPLPRLNQFEEKLSRWGIHKDSQLVTYDNLGGAYAARLWWMVRQLGHSSIAVLDGGIPKWKQEGRPLCSGAEQNRPAVFIAECSPKWDLEVSEVERIRLDPAYLLIDARAPARFRGEQEPIDPVAGHIPDAVNRFHGENLSAEGVFLPPEELRSQFLDLLHGIKPEHVVVYCGSGVTSCHHILAMEVAGLPGARLYPGSWSEWIRDPERPRAVGE